MWTQQCDFPSLVIVFGCLLLSHLNTHTHTLKIFKPFRTTNGHFPNCIAGTFWECPHWRHICQEKYGDPFQGSAKLYAAKCWTIFAFLIELRVIYFSCTEKKTTKLITGLEFVTSKNSLRELGMCNMIADRANNTSIQISKKLRFYQNCWGLLLTLHMDGVDMPSQVISVFSMSSRDSWLRLLSPGSSSRE